MCRSEQRHCQLGYIVGDIGEYVMQRSKFDPVSPLWSSPPPPPPKTLGAVNQRLVKAEQELRIQFSRIAQLQAQLDVVVGALRRSPGAMHA